MAGAANFIQNVARTPETGRMAVWGQRRFEKLSLRWIADLGIEDERIFTVIATGTKMFSIRSLGDLVLGPQQPQFRIYECRMEKLN